jgi:hypothetical protein
MLLKLVQKCKRLGEILENYNNRNRPGIIITNLILNNTSAIAMNPTNSMIIYIIPLFTIYTSDWHHDQWSEFAMFKFPAKFIITGR